MRDLNTLNKFREAEVERKLYGAKGGSTEGVFCIPAGNVDLRVIASAGGGWDHVSVSLRNRCPTWQEMCLVKDAFFEDTEIVMQLHPSKDKYVNIHMYTLHLWRPHDAEIPTPPLRYV